MRVTHGDPLYLLHQLAIEPHNEGVFQSKIHDLTEHREGELNVSSSGSPLTWRVSTRGKEHSLVGRLAANGGSNVGKP